MNDTTLSFTTNTTNSTSTGWNPNTLYYSYPIDSYKYSVDWNLKWNDITKASNPMKIMYCEKCGQKMEINDKTVIRYDQTTGKPVRKGKYVYTCPSGKKSHKRVKVQA